MQCLRNFFSWLFLLWQLWDAVHMIWISGKKQDRKEGKEEKHVIEGLAVSITARIDTETGHTNLYVTWKR